MARIAMLLTNDASHDARVRKEAATLASAGHDVVVFAVAGPGLPDVERLDGYEVRRVGEPMTAIGGALGRKLRNLATLRRTWARFADAASRERFDVIHAHDLDTLSPAVQAARRTGARLVYDSHELFPDAMFLDKARNAIDRGLARFQSWMWRRSETSLIGRADLVVTVNPLIAKELARRYGIAEPLVVMNAPAAEVAAEAGPRTLPLPPLPGTVFIYQGGLISDRGLPEMLEAFALVPEASLVVMGEGELKSSLAERASRRDLAARVRVVDAVPAGDVIASARSAAAGIIPFKPTTLNNRFASPNKLFDYLHAGIAIVASDLPFLASVVGPCDCGVLFEPGDVDAMAAAIRRLATDPELLASRRAGATACASRYTWDVEGARLVAAYAALLDGKGGAR